MGAKASAVAKSVTHKTVCLLHGHPGVHLPLHQYVPQQPQIGCPPVQIGEQIASVVEELLVIAVEPGGFPVGLPPDFTGFRIQMKALFQAIV